MTVGKVVEVTNGVISVEDAADGVAAADAAAVVTNGEEASNAAKIATKDVGLVAVAAVVAVTPMVAVAVVVTKIEIAARKSGSRLIADTFGKNPTLILSMITEANNIICLICNALLFINDFGHVATRYSSTDYVLINFVKNFLRIYS